MSADAGWYDDGSGRQRWWDGMEWTDQFAEQQPPARGLVVGLMGRVKDAASGVVSEAKHNVSYAKATVGAERADVPDTQPATPAAVYEVVSHIDGKNAKVRLYPDRLQWERGRGVSGAKMTAGIMTVGLSLLATGVRGGKDAYEMLPLNQITSVSNRKDGMLYHVVDVQTAGGTVGFRVNREDAARFREAILQQMQAKAANPVVVQFADPAATRTTAEPDHVVQLQQLAQLRDAGILTEDEFAAKKAEILTRM